MQWTIIRPGGLKNDPPTGSGVLTLDNKICGAINREDVADLVVKALFSDKSNSKVRWLSTPLYSHACIVTVEEYCTSCADGTEGGNELQSAAWQE
jgi:hypothetical protein